MAVPKSCPHCGTIVQAQKDQFRLQCPNCTSRFLNIAPDKLQLGTTVLMAKSPQNLGKLDLQKFDSQKFNIYDRSHSGPSLK